MRRGAGGGACQLVVRKSTTDNSQMTGHCIALGMCLAVWCLVVGWADRQLEVFAESS